MRKTSRSGAPLPLDADFQARGRQMVAQLEAISSQFMSRMFARQIANSLWALSRTPQLHSPTTRPFMRSLMQELAAQDFQKLFKVGDRPVESRGGLSCWKPRVPSFAPAQRPSF